MRRATWPVTIPIVILMVVTMLGLAVYLVIKGVADTEAIGDPLTVEGLAMSSDDPIDFQPVNAAYDDERRPGVWSARLISQLTGADSPARTDERWNITGTDLGFSFEHQDSLYMVFGDTWGRGGSEGHDWRSNVMAVAEPDTEHGYVLTDVIKDGNGEAKELLSSLKQPGREYTVIPTTGISDGQRMYLHYMSIRDWDEHWWGYKEPVVNGAGLAYSDDAGQSWTKDDVAYWDDNSPFTQAAMVENDDAVYMFGTPAGRFGPASLLRVPSTELLLPDRYEYWNGDSWVADIGSAAAVVPAPVGELSVRWSPHHQRWLMMYLNDETHNIVLRTAGQLEGPWSEEQVIVSAEEYPTLYGPFILPITGPEIHFTMSTFTPKYQVFVMQLTSGPE